jgi:DNA-binding XRE family transcriptional regulator
MAKKAPNPIDKHVGSRVRMRRNMLGMSQGKLGQLLGITFQQVQKYEKGTNGIRGSRMQAIADALQVPVSFFFEGAPHVSGKSGNLGGAPSPVYVTNFMATTVGLSLATSGARITDQAVLRDFASLFARIAENYPDPNVLPFVSRKQTKAQGSERPKSRATG